MSTPTTLELGAMHAALQTHTTFPSGSNTKMWLSRICKTASHELGHCLGLDHCVYYACIMQGTASLVEDARQPPYFCPVCLAKVLRATGTDEVDRYTEMLKLCDGWSEDSALWESHRAWIIGRLCEIKKLGGV